MSHLLLLLALSSAPSAPGLSAFIGLPFDPVVGEWAEYRLKRTGETTEKVRIAVVGSVKEIPGAHWIELEVDRPDQRLRVKLLTVGNPAEPGALRKIVAELGPGMVMEFPVPPEEPNATPPPATKRGKPQRIKTAAGTFKAAPLKLPVATSWVADEVPIFGLVKGTSNEGTIELLGFGTGAESRITGTPQRMAVPLLPGQWSPGSAPAPSKPGAGGKP